MADTKPKAHVVLLPSPGIGHLTPITELAKRLVLSHNLTATIITFSDLSSGVQQSLLSSLPNGISSVSLPPIPLDDLPANTHIVTRLSIMISRSIPFLRQILLTLQKSAQIAAYIIDLFGGDTLCLATELGIRRYIFFTTNLFYHSFLLNLPALYQDQQEDDPDRLLSLPGCVPLHPMHFSPSATNKESDVSKWMIRHSEHHDRVDGIMVNSFEALEGGAARFFRERGNRKPQVLPIGPLTCDGGSEKGPAQCDPCLQWLDQQPAQSVLFVAFGSGGTLSLKQTRELALGLEMSGQRFVWVVRAPADVDASASYFSQGKDDDALGFLPRGFVERSKGRGVVVASWGPQAEILAHGATGGFLSHCGWNSTLESIRNGVPMIAWPLYSEQPMNAVMLVEGLKVALRPGGMDRCDGVVRKEEIADVVSDLMEGEGGKDVRRRMQELKTAAVRATGVEGSSSRALARLVNGWKI